MDNRNNKKNKQQKNQNPNLDTKTEVLNAKEEKKNTEEKAANTKVKPENTKKEVNKEKVKKEEPKKEESKKEESKKEEPKKEAPKKENVSKGAGPKENIKKEVPSEPVRVKTVADASAEHIKGQAMNTAKILLPVAACAIIIAVVIAVVSSQKSQIVTVDNANAEDSSNTAGVVSLSDEPLAENAYASVNELMRAFCTALADGDMDTVKNIKDYNTDREIITYAEKSEFIESYNNVNCYTKPGVAENSYFVYVTYSVKFKDIETEAPGLNAFYVYTADDGSLKIDGDTEENIKAAFKVVTSQDDVVDLYNKIDVSYNEATASDEALGQFMADLPGVIKESVGVALAQLESGDTSQPEANETPSTETQTSAENEEPLQNQVVNQIVRTTDTVNVRSSDSEEADKIGKAQAGTELKRIEERINGWSKVIFEDKEAYIKSDYLEVVTTEVADAPVDTGADTVTATTNVNVRNKASQDSDRIGSATAGTSYKLLEDQGEWYKIDYNGTTGFVKSEFFTR